MSVPGGDRTLRSHEVIYVREGKIYKYIVVILLTLILLLTAIYLPKILRNVKHVLHGEGHGHHKHGHHHHRHHEHQQHHQHQQQHQQQQQLQANQIQKRTIDMVSILQGGMQQLTQKMEKLQNDLQLERNGRQRIIDEKSFQLRERIEVKVNEIKKTIEEKHEELKQKMAFSGERTEKTERTGRTGHKEGWRRGDDWVDDELRRAKQEFKRKYQDSFEDRNDL